MKRRVILLTAAIGLLCLFLLSYNFIFQDYREQKRSELVEEIDAKGGIKKYEVKYEVSYAATAENGKEVIRTSAAYDPISYDTLEGAKNSTSDTTVASLLANIEREARENKDQMQDGWEDSVTVKKTVEDIR